MSSTHNDPDIRLPQTIHRPELQSRMQRSVYALSPLCRESSPMERNLLATQAILKVRVRSRSRGIGRRRMTVAAVFGGLAVIRAVARYGVKFSTTS
ncbi:MAG: hypothetical protein P8Z69_03690 [Acidihalobacter sp.]